MENTFDQILKLSTTTFQNYEHEIIHPGRPTVWHFMAINKRSRKNYLVYCVTAIKKVAPLIDMALEQKDKHSRLVVVCKSCEQEDLQVAKEKNYCLVTSQTLDDYNYDMTVAKLATGKVSTSDLGIVDFGRVITKQ
ncbi:MAG: hypothetical protein A2504_13430 [Bdellovibrionales bacterium RIFOXYD12_FULL_39_22]|nr:MAG: hypothetical protein A2385_01230 [Bdellovibrionales bacterium RIFOXYB1_FULL_39_21]OFZ43628.1 MAG: hypothetical protein A2485_12900 [Bdellovibrionales bacterium RIFOXYC12_FULL_39_17]OFZ44647.1 MAG: hypothetical protein A2404_10590 [Bdellovibrionales bacterium RIFOXYC1_FULL_39_130]OFZ76406.1 MAG: hypothetical protein A2560_07210 [Bdellovibrionales bacterium RIFOXYD1_FULL_39_84]OFZ94672.1 MAG: hypothetical protein A2504_13430 [Bdellovibrionales bacterium RIFOXYD12_FULL_39_22]HLE12870.1 hy